MIQTPRSDCQYWICSFWKLLWLHFN